MPGERRPGQLRHEALPDVRRLGGGEQVVAKGTGFVPCTNCGGTGATTVTEIDNKGNTKQVRVVCRVCGGKGGHHV